MMHKWQRCGLQLVLSWPSSSSTAPPARFRTSPTSSPHASLPLQTLRADLSHSIQYLPAHGTCNLCNSNGQNKERVSQRLSNVFFVAMSDAAAAVIPVCSCDQAFSLNGVVGLHRASCLVVACNCDCNYAWRSFCRCRTADYLACQFCMSGDPDEPHTGLHHPSCPQVSYVVVQSDELVRG